MIFFTKVPIGQIQKTYQIDYHSNILSIGSCFADHLSQKMEYFQFKICSNPFGVLFHPLAIEKIFHRCVNQILFTEEDIHFYDELWYCFDVHSQYSNIDKYLLISKLNERLNEFNVALSQASHLIITLGTAWVYRQIALNQLVANCHKIPQQNFKKEILSVSVIEESLQRIVHLLREKNPNLQMIFTISPVRHLKDGFVENQRSKSHLFSALHSFLENNPQYFYFPSYEILMDELRDYRFYAQDLLHPSEQAIEYIWQRFCESFIKEETRQIMKQIGVIQSGVEHRALHPDTQKHQLFIENLKRKIQDLRQKVHHLTFEI